MTIFNCSSEWPVCLFDFTLKSRCPNFYVFKISYQMTEFIIDDYFYGNSNFQAVSGKYNPLFQDLDHKNFLIE